MKKEIKINRTFKIEESLWRRARDVAEEEGRSISNLVRYLLELYADRRIEIRQRPKR